MSTATLSATSTSLRLAVSGGPFAWRPSRLRTLRVVDFAGPPQRAANATPLPLAWPNHAQGAELDYSLDFGEIVAPADSLAVSSSSADLVVGGIVASGRLLTVWLSGGIAGASYEVTVALSKGGRTWRPIVSLYAAA